MAKKLVISEAQIKRSRVDFDRQAFEDAVMQKGLLMEIEPYIPCPCRNKTSGQPDVSCSTCNGSGFFFEEAFEARGMIQSIGYNPKYQNYGKIDEGSAMLTLNFDSRIGWMDRVTVMQGNEIHAEAVYPSNQTLDGNPECAALLIYPPTSVQFARLYMDENTSPTELVEDTDFTISGRRLLLSDSLRGNLGSGENYRVSIRYKHRPQYLVMHIDHSIRNTNVLKTGDREELENMPIKCMIKKTHFVIGDKGYNQ